LVKQLQMDGLEIILFSEKYLLVRGLVEIIKDVNNNAHLTEAQSLEETKSLIIDRRFDFLIIENVDFERLYSINLKNNLEHTKIIVIGKVDNIANLEFVIYDIIPKRANKFEILEYFSNLFSFKKIEKDEVDVLSEREREIVKLVALGYSNKEIAEELFLSVHTVTTHRKNISRKLGIKSISGLTIYAILNEIITINDKNREE